MLIRGLPGRVQEHGGRDPLGADDADGSVRRYAPCATRRVADAFDRSPVSQNAGEVRGTLDRAAYMLDISTNALADVELKDTDKPGFRRFIKREPLGVVLVIAPWK